MDVETIKKESSDIIEKFKASGVSKPLNIKSLVALKSIQLKNCSSQNFFQIHHKIDNNISDLSSLSIVQQTKPVVESKTTMNLFRSYGMILANNRSPMNWLLKSKRIWLKRNNFNKNINMSKIISDSCVFGINLRFEKYCDEKLSYITPNHRWCHFYYPRGISLNKNHVLELEHAVGNTCSPCKGSTEYNEKKILNAEMNDAVSLLLPTTLEFCMELGRQPNIMIQNLTQEFDMTGHLQSQKSIVSEMQILIYIYQICQAVFWLHTRPVPIIHKDIRCRNIIVSTTKNTNSWLAKLSICGAGSLAKYTDNYPDNLRNKEANRYPSVLNSDEYSEPITRIDAKLDRSRATQIQRNHKAVIPLYDGPSDSINEDFLSGKQKNIKKSFAHNIKYHQDEFVFHQPPEIHKRILNKEVTRFTKRTDIYQLGCTMWEMISYGQRPFSLNGLNLDEAGKKPITEYKIFNIHEKDVEKIIKSNLFSYKKYILDTASYNQPMLNTLIKLCTSFEPIQRPTIENITRFYFPNILSVNGINTKATLCSCGKKTTKDLKYGFRYANNFWF